VLGFAAAVLALPKIKELTLPLDMDEDLQIWRSKA
jgi:hypothetical protein